MADDDNSNSGSETSAASQVWNNSLIIDGVVELMSSSSLAQMCLVNKQSWFYAIKHFWAYPTPEHMNKFKIFSASVALKPLYKIGDHSTYGSLVRTLDLSMLGGRWEKLGFKDLAPVFECCTSMKGIDLGLCQHIKDAQMIKLFEDNPHLSTNIIHLNLDEVMLTDETLAKIVRMLPSLQQLDIAETHAGYDTCAAIGDCLPNLKSLVLEDCEDIDDECIEKIAKGCTDLAYLKIRGCTSILTDSVGDILMEYDNFAVVSEGSGDDYENDDMYEDGEYPYEDYNYNDYDSDEDDYYDDYYEDNKDDDED